jgi:hypothetical protein
MSVVTANKPRTVLFASLIGTTIEFYDFYIYATAAVLVFPRLFFPTADPGAAMLRARWARPCSATSVTAWVARQPWLPRC